MSGARGFFKRSLRVSVPRLGIEGTIRGYTDTELWEEIARLREFGEHYSGAAQEAWDRIVVLEAALREIMDLAGMTEGPYYPRAFSIAKAVLAAGSASPGGAET